MRPLSSALLCADRDLDLACESQPGVLVLPDAELAVQAGQQHQLVLMLALVLLAMPAEE